MKEWDLLYDDLLTGHFVGSLSSEEEERLGKLLSEDEMFRHRYNEMSKLFSISSIRTIESQKKTNYEQLKSRLKNNLSPLKNEKKGIRLWFTNYRKISAILLLSIILCGSIIGVSLLKNRQENKTEIFETIALKDSKTKMLLPDSSIVWLNSESKLIYDSDFGRKERRVFLQGEAYFDITRNTRCPFYVQTKDIEAKVVGTTFNLDAYENQDSVSIFLIEGKVIIGVKGKKDTEITLKPNQILTYDKQTKDISIKDVDSDKYSTWISDKLTFDNATFSQIIKMIEEKYRKTIIIKNKKLNNEVFSGSIDTKLSLEEAISTFDVERKFSLIQEGDTLYLY